MINEIELEKDGFKLSYFDENQDLKIEKFNLQPYDWVKLKEGSNTKFFSWKGEPVIKIPSKNRVSKFNMMEFLWDLPQEKQDSIFAMVSPKRSIVDIEIDWRGGNDPEYKIPITTIGITKGNKCLVLGLKDLSKEDERNIEEMCNRDISHLNAKYSFSYRKMPNETTMLSAFWFKIVPDLGIMTGWNFENFDMTYLINRANKLGLDLSKVSPTGTVNHLGKPRHIPAIDYAAIFKKLDKSIEVSIDNTLDFVSGELLSVKKVAYKGSLGELYDSDFKKYVYYNIVDCILVNEIDKKTQVLDLTCSIASLVKVEFNSANSPVRCGESLLSQEYWKRGLVIDTGSRGKKQKYPGAFVKQPIPGKYRGIAVYDYSSLYPSTMRSLDLSPESYVGIFKGRDLETYKNSKDYVVTSIGTVFKKSDSALKAILTDFYAKRKWNQKLSKEYQRDANDLKNYLKSIT